MDKWNSLVKEVNQNFCKKENEIQALWEDLFADSYFFGYSKRNGELDSHRSIAIGSRDRTIPDIIIRDTLNGKDLFVVELKQHNLPFDEHYKEQLFSYMRLLGLNIGVLIGDKIYIYILLNGKLEKMLSIPFVENNENGKMFIKLFSKGLFSEEDINQFINVKNNFFNNVRKIKKDLQSLSIESLIKEYYKDEYSLEEIDEVLKDLSVTISLKKLEAQTTEIKTNTIVQNTNWRKQVAVATAQSTNDDCYQEPSEFDYIIIKTSQDRVNYCKGSLYEATRYAWRVTFEKVSKYPYVFSVINGVVRAVYKVKNWSLITYGESVGRYEFFGEEAPTEISSRFVGKIIPEYYRKKGMASPVVYKQ